MLTPEEIEGTYDELKKMFVQLDSSPEKGLTYIKERLTLGRAMQDRVAELRLRVNRALSDVLERHLIAQQIHELAPTPDTKKAVKDLEVLKQRHTMLTKMIAMQAQVLSRTAMDIRLLADLTKEQIKRGEINPHEAPGLVQDVPVSEMATTPAVSDNLPQLEPVPLSPVNQALLGGYQPRAQAQGVPPSSTTAVMVQFPPGVELVALGQPVLGTDDDRMTLQDTDKPVTFEDLFKEPDHGETVTPVC